MVTIPTVSYCPMPPVLSSDFSVLLFSSKPWKQFPADAVSPSPVSWILNHTVNVSLYLLHGIKKLFAAAIGSDLARYPLLY